MSAESNEKIDIVDARGLPCPQPVALVRNCLRGKSPGSRVMLMATDPMASVDIRAFCLRGGHRLVAEFNERQHFRFEIERG